MKKDKSDKRVEKTECALRSAFSRLISQKKVNEITVKELCRLADINKSTFYLHYHDIYDLEKSFYETIAAQIGLIFQEYDYEQLISCSTKIMYRILKLFDGSAPLYVSFRRGDALSRILSGADTYITDILYETLQKKQPSLSQEKLAAHKLNITFIVNGYIGLIRRYAIEKMSDQSLALLAHSLEHGFSPIFPQ